jgi:hypothetical protein
MVLEEFVNEDMAELYTSTVVNRPTGFWGRGPFSCQPERTILTNRARRKMFLHSPSSNVWCRLKSTLCRLHGLYGNEEPCSLGID